MAPRLTPAVRQAVHMLRVPGPALTPAVRQAVLGPALQFAPIQMAPPPIPVVRQVQRQTVQRPKSK